MNYKLKPLLVKYTFEEERYETIYTFKYATIDKELLRLSSEANAKYGEYKALLNTLELDSSYFLNSVLLTESYKSTQIEGTQIS